MPSGRLTKLGAIARVFGGASKHGRTVLLSESEAEKRRQRGEGVHSLNLLGMSAVDDGRLVWEQAEIAWVEEARLAEPYLIRAGDVLLASRSTVLRSCIVPAIATGFAINSTLICIRTDEVDPRLIAAYLRHPQGQAALLKSVGSSTSQMNITIKSVSELTLPVPPSDVQRRLGDLLDAAAEQRLIAIEAAEKSYSIALRIAVDQMSRLGSQGGER